MGAAEPAGEHEQRHVDERRQRIDDEESRERPAHGAGSETHRAADAGNEPRDHDRRVAEAVEASASVIERQLLSPPKERTAPCRVKDRVAEHDRRNADSDRHDGPHRSRRDQHGIFGQRQPDRGREERKGEKDDRHARCVAGSAPTRRGAKRR
jgi:hypothetical protein